MRNPPKASRSHALVLFGRQVQIEGGRSAVRRASAAVDGQQRELDPFLEPSAPLREPQGPSEYFDDDIHDAFPGVASKWNRVNTQRQSARGQWTREERVEIARERRPRRGDWFGRGSDSPRKRISNRWHRRRRWLFRPACGRWRNRCRGNRIALARDDPNAGPIDLHADVAKITRPATRLRRVADDVVIAAVLDNPRERAGEVRPIDGGESAGRLGHVPQRPNRIGVLALDARAHDH